MSLLTAAPEIPDSLQETLSDHFFLDITLPNQWALISNGPSILRPASARAALTLFSSLPMAFLEDKEVWTHYFKQVASGAWDIPDNIVVYLDVDGPRYPEEEMTGDSPVGITGTIYWFQLEYINHQSGMYVPEHMDILGRIRLILKPKKIHPPHPTWRGILEGLNGYHSEYSADGGFQGSKYTVATTAYSYANHSLLTVSSL